MPYNKTFEDDFNRANTGNGGVANGWTDQEGVWQINANRAAPYGTFDDDGIGCLLYREGAEGTFLDGKVRLKLIQEDRVGVSVRGDLGNPSVGQGLTAFYKTGIGISFGFNGSGYGSTVITAYSFSPDPNYFELEASGDTFTATVFGGDGTTVIAKSVATLGGIGAGIWSLVGATPSHAATDGIEVYEYYSGPLVGAVITAGATTARMVAMQSVGATGGAGAKTYQWYRSTTPGSKGTTLTGKTSRNLYDGTVSPGVTYYYTLDATDTTGTASSAQVSNTADNTPTITTVKRHGTYNSFGTAFDTTSIPIELDNAIAAISSLDSLTFTSTFTTHPGYQTSQLTELYESETAIEYDASKGRNVLMFCEGTNDLIINCSTETPAATCAANAFARTMAFVAKAHATGWEVGINYVIKRNDSPPVAFEDARVAYNALVATAVANGLVEFVYDPTTRSELSNPSNPTYFDNFEVHPQNAGAVVYGDVMAQALAAYLAPGTITPPVDTTYPEPITFPEINIPIGARMNIFSAPRPVVEIPLPTTISWPGISTATAYDVRKNGAILSADQDELFYSGSLMQGDVIQVTAKDETGKTIAVYDSVTILEDKQ